MSGHVAIRRRAFVSGYLLAESVWAFLNLAQAPVDMEIDQGWGILSAKGRCI